MPTEQERQDAINYHASALILLHYSVPNRLRISREMQQLFQRHLSGETLSDGDRALAQTDWQTWVYPLAIRAYSRLLIADPTKNASDTGWPSPDQSPSTLPAVWTDGVALSRVAGLQTFVDSRIQDAIGVAQQALDALTELSSLLANETDAVAGLVAQIASKFTTPAGMTAQYVRGDGTLGDFPSLADVAITGQYDSLDGLPTLGTMAAQDSSEFDAAGSAASAQSYAIQRANQTGTQVASTISDFSAASLLAVTWSTLTGKPTLSSVATSGAYADLTGKPTIPAAQVNTDWNASSGITQLLNKPLLATVATTGAYADLSGKPSLGTASTQNISAFDAAGSAASAQTASQPLDGDLTAIAALLGTNTIYYRSAANAWSAVTVGSNLSFIGGTLSASAPGTGTVTSITASSPAAGFTVSGGPITSSGTLTFALSNDLASLEALNSTGIIPYRSAADTWATVTIGAPIVFTTGTLTVSAATTGAAGSMSSADKAKLDSLTLIGGYPAMTVTSVSTTYTALATDELIRGDTSTAAFTITLPTAVGISGKEFVVKNMGSKVLTIAFNGSETADGQTTVKITAKYSSLNFVSNGTNWDLI